MKNKMFSLVESNKVSNPDGYATLKNLHRDVILGNEDSTVRWINKSNQVHQNNLSVTSRINSNYYKLFYNKNEASSNE